MLENVDTRFTDIRNKNVPEDEQAASIATVVGLLQAFGKWCEENPGKLQIEKLLWVAKSLQSVLNTVTHAFMQAGKEGACALEALETLPWSDMKKHMEFIDYLCLHSRKLKQISEGGLYVGLLADQAANLESMATEMLLGVVEIDKKVDAMLDLKRLADEEVRKFEAGK